MTGIWVSILYCSGICPAWIPPPNGVLLYTSREACEASNKRFESDQPITARGPDGRLIQGVRQKVTCATVYMNPQEFEKLSRMLAGKP